MVGVKVGALVGAVAGVTLCGALLVQVGGSSASAASAAPPAALVVAATPPPPVPAPLPAPLVVLPLGDSLMVGNNGPSLRSELFDRLVASGQPVRYVGVTKQFWNGQFSEELTRPAAPNNVMSADGGLCILADNQRGCGFNSGGPPKGILGLLEASYAAGINPDVYVIMAGINDRFCNLDPGATNSEGVQPCVQPLGARFEILLNRIYAKSPTALVVFSTGKDFAQEKNFFDAERPGLEQLAEKYRAAGRRIVFVDAWKGVIAADMADSVHPGPSGARLVGQNYFEAMKPLLVAPAATPAPTTLQKGSKPSSKSKAATTTKKKSKKPGKKPVKASATTKK
jgi:lysophospholipase L1-like esterase